MEKEVSTVVTLSIMLIAMAVVLSIVWFTVFLGRDMSQNVSYEASNMVAETSVGAIEELVGKESVEMPTSAAYSLIRTYGSYIESFYCHDEENCYLFDDEAVEQFPYKYDVCLQSHLNGKVKLTATVTETGGYRIDVSPVRHVGSEG